MGPRAAVAAGEGSWDLVLPSPRRLPPRSASISYLIVRRLSGLRAHKYDAVYSNSKPCINLSYRLGDYGACGPGCSTWDLKISQCEQNR